MSLLLKPLQHQVLFITGATSGIGLATVHLAVDQGAKVFMVARNEEELQKIQDEMRLKGLPTAFAVADVAEFDQLQSAADRCLATFGTIDTWINNAGISIYGRLLDTTEDEAKRLFDTNFWGVVNGCKVAALVLKEKGGAIINIGSTLSKVSLPIQGIYSASKHAVKAYTDALRRELLADKAPISVTLVMPGAIDTPYTLHARSHIGEPVHSGPVYSAEVVARKILECAVKPEREVGVGAQSYILPFFDRVFPKLGDLFMSRKFMEKDQSLEKAKTPREHGDAGNLFTAPTEEGETKGNFPGHVLQSSASSEVVQHSSLIAGGLAVVGGGLLLFRKLRII